MQRRPGGLDLREIHHPARLLIHAPRYADLDALAGVWPVAREEILVPSGQSTSLSVVEDSEGAVARHLVIELEAGASFDLRILNCGAAFGRIAVDAQLGEGASFTLGAAQLGSGVQVLEIVTEVSHRAVHQSPRAVIVPASKTQT
jgi:Fe-S cluster assembly protein SufD